MAPHSIIGGVMMDVSISRISLRIKGLFTPAIKSLHSPESLGMENKLEKDFRSDGGLSIFLISHLLGNIVPKWRLLPFQTQFCSSPVTSFNINFVNFRLHKTDFLIGRLYFPSYQWRRWIQKAAKYQNWKFIGDYFVHDDDCNTNTINKGGSTAATGWLILRRT